MDTHKIIPFADLQRRRDERLAVRTALSDEDEDASDETADGLDEFSAFLDGMIAEFAQ